MKVYVLVYGKCGLEFSNPLFFGVFLSREDAKKQMEKELKRNCYEKIDGYHFYTIEKIINKVNE